MRRRRKLLGHPELGLPEVRKPWQIEGLFSDHYLKARIQKNPWWPTNADTEPIWRFCKDLYEKRYLALAKNNEAFTRRELIDKVLEKLGFAAIDNLGLPETQQDLEPDYVLFPSAAEKEAVLDKDKAAQYRTAAALLEAKKLNHPLSQISKHQQRYPHQQIRDYLNEAQVVPWGILTNGNEWRLYCRDAKPSHFFGLNFEVAIKSLDGFKVFLALFSPAAFVRDAQGKCRLDAVREGALAAQTELEEDLRQRIFGILETLANGFAKRPDNDIGPDELPNLYQNCLILLYRLLFILYAEGRQLLPVEPKSRKYYKELSLARLMIPLKNFSEYDSRTRTRLYEDILELSHLVNGTDEKKNAEYSVPRYNGGLFDPERYPRLERWRICDAPVAEVLRGLMFNPLPQPNQPSLPVETVDFGDLRVQQLGSIYEGLLEHHLERERDRLVLKTDSAERKATGTYYTPDYIVKYIVENTVGPLLKEIDERDPVKASRAAGLKDNSFVNEVLKLNICDPAMGSGHFLVEATIYLADHIVYHPTTKFQAEFKVGESQEEKEIAYWRRRVAEACIYGVDLNPLAVELAKLSLWLTTIASDQPLNFLDHHLRCGNSLIGARLKDLGGLPEKKRKKPGAVQTQFSFGPDFKQAVAETIRQIQSIESQASDDVASVKRKETAWAQNILPALAPYKLVADLWTNQFFDGSLDNESYVAMAQKILQQKVATPEGTSRRFFHWEMEFPDVFFAEDGSEKVDPGFDAVIGNPPYIGFHGMEGQKACLKTLYASCAGKFDIYIAFIERCLALVRLDECLCFICPSTFMKRDYAEAFRRVFRNRWRLLSLIDFGSKQVFDDATNYTCIPLIQNSGTTDEYAFMYNHGDMGKAFLTLPSTLLKPEGWILAEPYLLQPLKKLLDPARTEQLGALAAAISEGVVTGCNDVFVLNEDKIAEQGIEPVFLKRLLSGQHVFSFGLSWEDGYVVYPYQNAGGRAVVVPEEQLAAKSPRLWLYLCANRQRLSGRGYFEKSTKAWYELWNQRNFEVQSTRKVVVAEIELTGNFARAEDEYFYGDTVCGLTFRTSSPYAEGYLLAILNSQALSFVMRSISVPKANGYLIFKPMYLSRLPIRRISFTTEASERKRDHQQFGKMYERYLTGQNEREVLGFVGARLDPDCERTDVIHDALDDLGQQMTELNQQKVAETSGFLSWLERQVGAKVDSLDGRTKIRSYYERGADSLLAILRQNRDKLRGHTNPAARVFQESLEPEFEASMNRVRGLQNRIAATRKLIDQIVFALYGLSEDEADAVRSHAGSRVRGGYSGR